MIYDQDFKITIYGGGDHAIIRLKNNTINVAYISPYDKFEILYVDDLLVSTVYTSIFEYYGIDKKELIICKQVSNANTDYFINYHSDEIMILNSPIASRKYLLHSDNCSDKLLTTIELIGI